ncbi:uncharacterized protein LOC129867569 [Salvelinus fontinalis]|uniref:uncharacterized protein LOC129867569 n=1 Tax=Salvelinus fontinalis TaxID=8038 RepID=UPI002486C528|nr:uncharacterized protein LOC129867569 [Salvelinus fontinalis]
MEEPTCHVQAGVMLEDLRKLVTWAHSHGSHCPHKLWHKGKLNPGVGHQCKVNWRCEVGHAFDWALTLATEVKVEEEKTEGEVDVGHRSKRRRIQHLSSDEEEEMVYTPFNGNITDENGVESDVSHCSLVAHVSREGGDATVRMLEEALTLKSKQQRTVKQPFFPRMIVKEHPKGNIHMEVRVDLEQKNKESNQEGRGIEKRTVLKEESPGPNENLITALDITPLRSCLSDIERAPEDEEWATPKGGQCSLSPPEPKPLFQGQGETHRQGSCSAAVFPPTPERSGAASGHCPPNKGKVKTAPKKPAEKRGPKRAEASLGNLMTFIMWLNSQNHSAARCPGSLPIAELDRLLVAFFQYVWEESRLQALSSSTLTTYARMLDRDLQNQGCSFSIRKSAEFTNTIRELDNCCQNLKQREWDRDILVIQSLRREEEAALRQAGVLSRATPDGLLNLVLLNNLKAFGKFHLQGVWPGRVSDFHTATETHPGTCDGEKLEYLEWNNTNFPEQSPVRMHGLADDPERCPLWDYKLYVSKRVGSHLIASDAMYCCPLSQCRPWDNHWFSRHAMPKPRLEKIIKSLSHHILSVRNGRAAAVY